MEIIKFRRTQDMHLVQKPLSLAGCVTFGHEAQAVNKDYDYRLPSQRCRLRQAGKNLEIITPRV